MPGAAPGMRGGRVSDPAIVAAISDRGFSLRTLVHVVRASDPACIRA
jgi:hypothetical protein